jgi:hypothetical protein
MFNNNKEEELKGGLRGPMVKTLDFQAGGSGFDSQWGHKKKK